MDEKETQSQGICRKLYNLIMKTLALQAMKKEPLGRPTSEGSTAAPPSDAIQGSAGEKLGIEKTNTVEMSDSSTSLGSLLQNDQVKDETEFSTAQGRDNTGIAEEEASAQPKAPKKMVSINDRVEEIHKIMKKRKKSKSFDRSNSFGSGEDEPKPLRSILKVGSNRDQDKTQAFVNQNES